MWERGDFHWKYMSPLSILANDTDQMIKDVASLRDGKTIYVKDYDHETGKFTEPEEIKPTEYIIVTGLHTMKLEADLKIFMNTDKSLRYLWKMERDFKERGYEVTDIIDKIKEREIDFQNYILPQAMRADLVLTYYWDKELKLKIERINERELTNTILGMIDERL
jgi:uridine kinase